MGTVIHLSKGHAQYETKRAARTGDAGRVALVLGGGGITGAAYHLGVLNAMNAMSQRASVNDFDLYVGTSAGPSSRPVSPTGSPPRTSSSPTWGTRLPRSRGSVLTR
jgi:hypothetical protein